MAGAVRIRSQLLVAFVVPAVLAIALLAWFADAAARRSLDDALGERLSSIAQAAATAVPARVMALERGDDDARSRRSAMKKLGRLQAATGVARILVVRTEGDEAILDTEGTLRVGDVYDRARFDRLEIEGTKKKQGSASVLFEGPGGMPYKTGYAAFLGDEDEVLGYVAVNAAASYTDAIDELRRTVAGIALFAILSLAAAALLIARRLSDPIAALSASAATIGEGRLDADIPIGGPEETVVLGKTMRAMTRSLEARDEEMQMMLAGIAHEVRNPLGGIELFGGLLREDLEEGDKRRKHVDKILRELGTLSKVVNDFLDFARRAEPDPRPTNLHDMLFEVVTIAEKDAADKGTKLDLDVDSKLEAKLDPEAMKRAILNLVRNAVQASPKEDGRVRIGATADGEGVQIVVEDNGPGIPSENSEEIFTPFFTTKQKGTGLGLALVKKSVVQHGGTIVVETANSGGARFVITLP